MKRLYIFHVLILFDTCNNTLRAILLKPPTLLGDIPVSICQLMIYDSKHPQTFSGLQQFSLNPHQQLWEAAVGHL